MKKCLDKSSTLDKNNYFDKNINIRVIYKSEELKEMLSDFQNNDYKYIGLDVEKMWAIKNSKFLIWLNKKYINDTYFTYFIT